MLDDRENLQIAPLRCRRRRRRRLLGQSNSGVNKINLLPFLVEPSSRGKKRPRDEVKNVLALSANEGIETTLIWTSYPACESMPSCNWVNHGQYDGEKL